jgi:AcrR family transcriptional regulator
MAPRNYRMDRRAEAAEATRQRIVAATLQLHGERGVLATSHKDVAERADVSVGTVYHHFPTVDAIVRACGAQVEELYPLPAAERIDVREPRARRIVALTDAVVAFYLRTPWLEKLRTERHQVRALDLGLALRETAIRQLIRRALGRSTAKQVAVIATLLDPAVINRLAGTMSQREASRTLAAIVNSWLEGERK